MGVPAQQNLVRRRLGGPLGRGSSARTVSVSGCQLSERFSLAAPVYARTCAFVKVWPWSSGATVIRSLTSQLRKPHSFGLEALLVSRARW